MLRLLVIFLMTPILSQAQEMMVTTGGRRLNVESYKLSDDGTMIEVRQCPTCLNSIPVDSVAELVSFNDEKIFHLKRLLTPSLKVAFLELLTCGKVTVYKRKSEYLEKGSAGQRPKKPKGSPDYSEVEQYYVEKGGFLKQILPAYGSDLQQGLLLKELVHDDVESAREIDNVKFRLDQESLLHVVEDYNARAFTPTDEVETDGLVSFLLDRHVKAPLSVTVNGASPALNDRVFTLQIPVTADSKVCITNGDYAKCMVVRGTRYFPLFFEVRVNKSGDEIRIKRSHSKQFSNAAGKVAGRGVR